MAVRTLILAGFAAIFAGQTDAATLKSGEYSVSVRLISAGSSCYNYDTFCADGLPNPTPYFGVNVGSPITATLRIDLRSKDYAGEKASLYWQGGVLFSSDTPFNKMSEEYYTTTGEYHDARIYLSEYGKVNGYMLRTFWHNPDVLMFAEMEFSELSIAPVPLPATAALLPLGIGSLFFIRRRRTKSIVKNRAK